MSIALDYNGVVANTTKRWIEIFNEKYSEQYDKLLITYSGTTWNFHKTLGIKKEDTYEIFKKCWREWDEIEPTEFMLSQKTSELHEMYGGLDIVTSIRPEYKESVERFLQKYKIRYDNIIFHRDKGKLQYDAFIDDSPIHAKNISGQNKSIFLYNQPWNQNIIEDKNITRVYSLDHIIHISRK